MVITYSHVAFASIKTFSGDVGRDEWSHLLSWITVTSVWGFVSVRTQEPTTIPVRCPRIPQGSERIKFYNDAFHLDLVGMCYSVSIIYDGAQLDDLHQMNKLDQADMIGLIEGVPEQCLQAVDRVDQVVFSKPHDFKNIVILGMGGSAIAGNLARSLHEDELPIPMAVISDYNIPAYVGVDTLVVASSYSGNTEETLAAYTSAHNRGARIVVMTAGGELARRAERDGHPSIKTPTGMQPRAAVAFSLCTLLVLFHRLGLISSVREAVDETISVLRQQRESFGSTVPFTQNTMKQLALACANKIPLVYGSGGWTSMAAYRWKCQVNENSKSLCFWNTFPELNHNEIVGWEYPKLTSPVYLIVLRDPDDDKRMHRRIDVTKEIMVNQVAGQIDLWARGRSKLAKLMSLVYPGDYFSLYLGLLYGMDPTPVAMIDLLKKKINESDSSLF